MSTATFDQLMEDVLQLPANVKELFAAALMLEDDQRQKLLDDLSDQEPLQQPEVKCNATSLTEAHNLHDQ